MRILRSKTLFTLSLIALIAAGTIHTMANIRIRFAKDKTSATVKGRVATGGRVCYFVHGKAGQTLTASLTTNSPNSLMMILESGEKGYTYLLDVSGQPSVCVDNLGRAGIFTLTVSIQ
jgi:hypothetical protein